MKQKPDQAFFRKILTANLEVDQAHDLCHTERVVANAEQLLLTENADADVVLTAAWLHDCVVLPKNHPNRKQASRFAAERAEEVLKETSFPSGKVEAVKHAIEAHSFSAGIEPRTIEAKIVQDADRLDALGAIGIARCLMVGGALDRPLYHPEQPLPKNREADDSRWTIDHFYQKLFKLPVLMQTRAGKAEAEKRVVRMKRFLEELSEEITSNPKTV